MPAEVRASISKLYLAGPEVFLRDATELGDAKKALCAKYGFEGVFPLDNQVDLKARPPRETGLHIGGLNEALIRTCDAIVANMTPFRGPSADVGTALEMGIAAGLGLVVCGYSNTAQTFFARTVAFLGQRTTSDADTTVRDGEGQSIEDFELHDNLMLESCIAVTRGVFFAHDATVGDALRATEGFEQCLRWLRDRVPSPGG